MRESTLDLSRRLQREVNRLVRGKRSLSENIQITSFSEFEMEATARLGIKKNWYNDFEKQTRFKQGTVEYWKLTGEVPYGALIICNILEPVSPIVQSPLRPGLIKILDCLKEQPMTTDETADIMGVNILTIRPRFTQLFQQDYIRDTGDRRTSAAGRGAIVWETTQKY